MVIQTDVMLNTGLVNTYFVLLCKTTEYTVQNNSFVVLSHVHTYWLLNTYIVCGFSYTRLFNKKKLYKNTQAENYPKTKNKLRLITRLKFWSEKFTKFI